MSFRPRREVPSPGFHGDGLGALLAQAQIEAARNAHESPLAAPIACDYSARRHHAAPLTELHPSMMPPPGLSDVDIDAWYDGVVKAAEAAKKGVSKLAKDVNDSTSQPSMYSATTAGGDKIKMPRAIYNFYKEILPKINDFEKADDLIDQSFWPDWTSKPNMGSPKDPYKTGQPGIAGFKGQVRFLASQFENLTWSTEAFYEATAGDWIPGGLKGTKTYVHVGKASATYKGTGPNALFPEIKKASGARFRDVLAIDVHTLVRDASDDGAWKIKHSWHVEDWLGAARQSGL